MLIEVAFARVDFLHDVRYVVVDPIHLDSSLGHGRVNGLGETMNLFNVISPILQSKPRTFHSTRWTSLSWRQSTAADGAGAKSIYNLAH